MVFSDSGFQRLWRRWKRRNMRRRRSLMGRQWIVCR